MAEADSTARLSLGQVFKCFNRRLLCTCLLVAISPFNYGFDNQGFASIQSLQTFAKQFGKYDPEAEEYILPTVWLSTFNAMPFLTFIGGVIIGSMVSRRFGRRMCIFTMSAWAIVCAVVIITSRTPRQILAGRCLNFIYVGMEISVIPVFQSEVTPRKVRGAVVGSYHLALLTGGLVINAIGAGTQKLQGNAQWLVPFGLFFTIPTIVCSLIWLVPESPRWLILNDRHEEARRNLHMLRVGAFTEEEIELEFQDMVATIQANKSLGTPSYLKLEIFKGANRRRTLITMGCNLFLQVTGQQFGSTYGAIFVRSLQTINQFYYRIMTQLLSMAVNVLVMYLSDAIGRRRLIFIGGTIQTLALLSMGCLGTVSDPSYSVRSGIVACMLLMDIGFTAGWAGVTQTLNSELSSTRLRDHTVRTGQVVAMLTQFVVTLVLPYLLNKPYANLQSKVAFIFFGTGVLGLVFAYTSVPDCRGRSLEDVDRLFEAGVPTRVFHKTDMSSLPLLQAAGDKDTDDARD